MKRQTTKKGPITSNKKLREKLIKCWEDMLQKTIQAWIEGYQSILRRLLPRKVIICIRKAGKWDNRKEEFIKVPMSSLCIITRDPQPLLKPSLRPIQATPTSY
jgi:hypothetical protein